MTGSFSFVINYILEVNGTDNIFWIMYAINFVLSAIAYELGFARKLSLPKAILIYALLLVGNFITTIFSIMMLPMTESIIIIVIVLAIYRSRLAMQRKSNNASE